MLSVYMLGASFPGCNYVRIRIPAYANGFNTDQKSMRSPRDDAQTIRQELARANVVVFHRPETEQFHKLADMLKKDGKKIVMDNDDTFYIDDHHPLANISPDGESLSLTERINSINEFIKKADLITASTKTLADEYRKFNPNVIVLPNCVDPDDWEEPLRNEGEQVRIGIVGSAAFEYDYLHVKDLIRKLSQRKDVKLVMFGLGDKNHRKQNKLTTKIFKEEYSFWDTIDKEHFPWCRIEDYPTVLNEARLDIMLIPRKDNYFNRCKSNVKFLEAAMCEIPVVAQSFLDAPYEELEDWVTGVKIKDNNDWEPAIERLIQDKALRRQIGQNAKKYALKHYDINNNYHLWADAYQAICK